MCAFTSNSDDVPVFILAPPRSFTSVVCAMLGQHPQMYGFPELHLFCASTMAEWSAQCSRTNRAMIHGLLRTVAQLVFDVQTEETIVLARAWIRRRAHMTTSYMFELLAKRVYPKISVDKSPSTVYSLKRMLRAYEMFPQARFIHLLRHPRSQGESLMKHIGLYPVRSEVPKWMVDLASFPCHSKPSAGEVQHRNTLDPQFGWFALNMKICNFLEFVPNQQKMTIRGEELMTNTDEAFGRIASFLGVRTDPAAIEEMKHPERSPYASFGPPGARRGNDRLFLSDPVLRPNVVKSQSLEGSLPWRGDRGGFSPEVVALARHFGYR
jgi:Sulfotransferase family